MNFVSYNNEENNDGKTNFIDGLIRIVPSFYDRYSRKFHFRKRIRSEKIL